MPRPFIRKVQTASGATAVQIVQKQGSDIVSLEHVGSARTQTELVLLIAAAKDKIFEMQPELDLFPGIDSDVFMQKAYSELLYKVLESQYDALGFNALADETFKQLVLARIIEPASKTDTIRILDNLGLKAPSNTGIYRCLRRIIEEDYRSSVSAICFERANTESLSLVLYDVTTLYFEVQKEDGYRIPGMSKERRLEPQITVGLLVGRDGFPLEIASFEGNKAEVKTIMEVLGAFKSRYGISDMTVTADAAMLSSQNVSELEEAGYHYIIGSRIAKTPYEIEEYTKVPGSELKDGQIFDLKIAMNTGKSQPRIERRVIYQYRSDRAQLDLLNIDKLLAKAQRMVAGTAEFKRNRFLRVSGSKKEINNELVEKSRLKAGIKGYVTDLDVPAQEVIDAYHQLFQVERSFRMAKSDLKARPIFHHVRDSIEAHLTVVFVALAISRHIQAKTGLSIRKFKHILEPLRTGVLSVNGAQHRYRPQLDKATRDILRSLNIDRIW